MCLYGLPFRARDALEEAGEEHVGGPIGAAPAATLAGVAAAPSGTAAPRGAATRHGAATGAYREERPPPILVSA